MSGDERDYSHRTRLDKLGVKPGMKVLIERVNDEEFSAEICSRGVTLAAPRAKNLDLIFLGVEDLAGLNRLQALASRILPDGGIWVIYPKGRKDLKDIHVIAAMKQAGLVDNKVVGFSATHTSLRAVVPVALRPQRQKPGAANIGSRAADKSREEGSVGPSCAVFAPAHGVLVSPKSWGMPSVLLNRGTDGTVPSWRRYRMRFHRPVPARGTCRRSSPHLSASPRCELSPKLKQSRK